MVNAPAVLLKTTPSTSQLTSTLGIRRVLPANVTVAVPLLAGTALGFQLFAELQLLSVAPPSHSAEAVVPQRARKASTISATRRMSRGRITSSPPFWVGRRSSQQVSTMLPLRPMSYRTCSSSRPRRFLRLLCRRAFRFLSIDGGKRLVDHLLKVPKRTRLLEDEIDPGLPDPGIVLLDRPPAYQDHRYAGALFFHPFRDLPSGKSRHAQVRDNQVERLPVEDPYALISVGCRDGLVPHEGKIPAKHFPVDLVVLDHEDLRLPSPLPHRFALGARPLLPRVRLERQGQEECGSHPFIAGHLDRAPVTRDDPVHDARSQSESVILGGEEGLEQFFLHLLAHPDSRVGHLQPYGISLAVCLQGQLAPSRHRLHGVEDEVADHLGEFGVVPPRGRDLPRFETDFDANPLRLALLLPLAPGHFQGISHNGIQIDGFDGQILPDPGEFLHPPDRRRPLEGNRPHHVELLVNVREVRRPGGKLRIEKFDSSQNPREQV